MTLGQEFQKYVGRIIKDPERLTADCDPVADAIVQEAAAQGLTVQFLKSGKTAKIDAGQPKLVCLLSKDGLPNGRTWGWCIKDVACV